MDSHSLAFTTKVIKEIVQSALQSCGTDINTVPLTKRSNDFEQGDFYVPSGCVKGTKARFTDENLANMLEEMKKKLPISRLSWNGHSLVCIHLERSDFFKNTIHTVLQQGKSFGKKYLESNSSVILCNRYFHGTSSGHIEKSVGVLRSMVLQEHIANLLTANGFDVTHAWNNPSEVTLALLKEAGVQIQNIRQMSGSHKDFTERAEKIVKTLPYVTEQDMGTNSKQSGKDKVEISDNSLSLTLNLKQYISDNGLKSGRSYFDKNLNLCCVYSEDKVCDIMVDAVMLQETMLQCHANRCLHIVHQAENVRQQKLSLLVDCLHKQMSHNIIQNSFVYSDACIVGDTTTNNDAVDFLSQRYRDLERVAVMKYGDEVQGEGWSNNLKALTAACVKFELLHVAAKTKVKVGGGEDAGETGGFVSTGAFVMYNCARLATLFSHFQQAVNNGTYEDLPPVECIDFSTLKEEEEWNLMFNFVFTYPDTVRQTLQDFIDSDCVVTNIHTHKICLMLEAISRCLSSYYSRYHILTEGHSHLLPVMYARLYLLKAVYQVIENALTLLGLDPITQL